MFNAIQYIYTNLFEPIISAIMLGLTNGMEQLFQLNNVFIQPMTITLFSDTAIITTSLYDITLLVLLVLFSIWFAKFILYLLKVPFNFFKGLGR